MTPSRRLALPPPSPIQELTLPVALSGQDIIGQAKTGTGKTLGFGLPTIQRVVGRDDEGWADLEYPGAPQALILVPTRELAIQVGEDLAIAAKLRNARVATLYGGVPIEPQAELLRRGLEGCSRHPRSHYRPVPAGLPELEAGQDCGPR